MIYTVTFNPSLDYVMEVNDFQIGKTNRSKDEKILPGGKGINVSVVLGNLGYETTALGFAGGFTGDEIIKRVERLGCKTEFIRVCGESRINVKIRNFDGTEINAAGPEINEEVFEKLLERLLQLKDGDVLVLAGSVLPVKKEYKKKTETAFDEVVADSSLTYAYIMKMLSDRNIRIVVDATKSLLTHTLKYHPFLIKPNIHELRDIFGVDIKTESEITEYARKLKEMGAVNVLVSMGPKGAILVDEEGNVHKAAAPKGVTVNSVGAGDSMIAGFLAGYMENNDYKRGFLTGLAAGSASAFSENLATKSEVEALYANS